jgi:hypothetical protein
MDQLLEKFPTLSVSMEQLTHYVNPFLKNKTKSTLESHVL